MKAGWKTVKLGEIALVGAGNSAPQDDADFSTDGPYFVRTSDVGEVKFGTVNSSNDRLSAKGAKGMRLWKAGTILIPKSGASTFVNHRVILGLDAHVSSHLATIQAEPTRCDGRYLLYYLSTVKAQDLIQDQSYPSLKLPEIAGIEIPLPPLAEQKRIVALLDEAFAGIEQAKIKVLRNGVNIRCVFESHLASTFAHRATLLPLSNFADEITDGDHAPPPKAQSGIPFITISDIDKRTRFINFRDTFKVTENYYDKLKPNKKPKVGDILYTVTGTLGMTVMVREKIKFCFQRHIGLIRPNANSDSMWLTYALRSPQAYRQACLGSTGAAQKTVSLRVLRNLKLPETSQLEQKEVAAKLNNIEIEIFHLEKLFEEKIGMLDEMKLSILAKAFAGELTA